MTAHSSSRECVHERVANDAWDQVRKLCAPSQRWVIIVEIRHSLDLNNPLARCAKLHEVQPEQIYLPANSARCTGRFHYESFRFHKLVSVKQLNLLGQNKSIQHLTMVAGLTRQSVEGATAFEADLAAKVYRH